MKHALIPASVMHPESPGWSARLRVIPASLPTFWRSWLFDQGSLTARLSALRPGQFSVECLREGYGQPTPTERQELGLLGSQPVWFREVRLLLAGTPIVYARTAVPVHAMTGKLSRLQHLGNRSLGSFLFSQPELERGQIRASHCKANDHGLQWARRSVFHIGRGSLLVTEAFSPDLCKFV